MTEDGLTRAERARVVRMFLAQIGPERTADFVVGLQDAVDGLNHNNASYVRHFAVMTAEQPCRELLDAIQWLVREAQQLPEEEYASVHAAVDAVRSVLGFS